MASINFNPFGGNWFSKPPNPLSLPSLSNMLNFPDPPSSHPNFAAISVPNLFRRKPQKKPDSTEPGPYEQMARQVLWECENLPDYRHTPEVEKILKDRDDSIFEKREDATEEEIRENAEMVEKLRSSPLVQFIARAEEILDAKNEMELEENERPYHSEDWDLWKNLPHVIGLDGRPMPRKAQKTRQEADDKFWDFARQFFFGLWNFRQRPYPPGKPIDAAQSIGYKNLEKRYYDYI
ncbi:Protein TIC 56, chloroplastic, partial [Mucuna pruriens]